MVAQLNVDGLAAAGKPTELIDTDGDLPPPEVLRQRPRRAGTTLVVTAQRAPVDLQGADMLLAISGPSR